MKLLLLLAVLPAIFAEQVLRADNDLTLLYRAQAGKDRTPIEAKLTLDCRNGVKGDQYRIDVTAVDAFARSDKSSILLVDVNGNTNEATGSGVLTVQGSLKDLALNARDKQCDGNADLLCGAVRHGSLLVRQYIIVPGSQSQLHWTGFYNVAFECRLEPLDPADARLTHEIITGPPLEECKNFTHNATTTRIDDTFSVKFDFTGNDYPTALDNCVIKPSAGSPITFLQNGLILNVPQMTVTGRAVEAGKQYELSIKDLTFAIGSDKAVISCQVTYCKTATEGNDAAPQCPEGDLPHAAASRSLLNTLRAEAPALRANANLDLEVDTVTLVVEDSANFLAGRKECTNKQ